MKSRLGIFGGAFDPVHQGHIQAARFALETLDLDAVQMIPCNVPNHKELCQPALRRWSAKTCPAG